LFQRVVFPAFLAEDVNHHISIIHEQPRGLTRQAFHMIRPHFRFPQPTGHVLYNGLHLGAAVAMTDHEHIREHRFFAHIQQNDVVGFFGRRGTGRNESFFQGV